MNFDSAYEIIGTITNDTVNEVMTKINECIKQDDFTYIDHNSKTKEHSWLRLDFATKPSVEHLIPLYDALNNMATELSNYPNIDPITNISVSMLKPLQTLDEHTDGRFIHRITNRYLVPLTESDKNYNYGYYNDEKIIYPLKKGKIYRVNNAIIHSALNLENTERYNILIDTQCNRLRQKFKNHPDLMKGLTVLGVNYYFEKNRAPQIKKANDNKDSK